MERTGMRLCESKKVVYKKTAGLAPFAYTIVDKWLYFCDQIIPGLFRYHLDKKVCECAAKFDRGDIKSHFYKIFSYGDELWMLPFWNEKIACFNMRTQQISYYDMCCKIKEKTIPFSNMFFWKEKAYITPHGNNRFLIVIDLAAHHMQAVELLQESAFFFNGAVQFQNQIYMVESAKGTVFSFDADSNETSSIPVAGCLPDYLFPEKSGDKIYFFPTVITREKEPLLLYDIRSGRFTEDTYPIRDLAIGEVCITAVFGREIWILANKKKKIYQVNCDLELESEISIRNFNEDGKTQYAAGTVFEDRFFWHGHRGDPLIQVKDGEVQFLDVGKDKTLLEVYIETVGKQSEDKKGIRGTGVGKLIYEDLIRTYVSDEI